ncbi:MAG: hypothetical protein BWK80_35745 [Desulfobacteraceae bacterium IS3]|nr:MAG: hypothetical protein BWK80_35745 [Desulfobacteraceae bacterium IS3]
MNEESKTASAVMMMDVISTVLDQPGNMAETVSELSRTIRQLTGSRITVIAVYSDTAAAYKIMHVNPARQTAIMQTDEGIQLVRTALRLGTSALLTETVMGFSLSLAIPFMINGDAHGVILSLGLMDEDFVKPIIELQDVLSKVVSIVLKNCLLIDELAVAKEKAEAATKALWGEMQLARKIQTCLLPTITDNFHPDFEITTAMLPADQVGGDFYDVTYDRKGNLWFAIGDVSGHGVTPGLIMMMAQTVHATVTTNIDCEARDVVVMINEILYKNVHERLKESHFMTFSALKYLGEGRFQHAGAHLSMIVFRQKTGACELIRTSGVYLNFKKDISKGTKNSEFCMETGDILVLYTDGLTESFSPDGRMLDLGGFVKIVESHARREPEAMKEMITADVLQWCDNRRADDMSIVIVKMKGNQILKDGEEPV